MKTLVTLIMLCALWPNVIAQAPQKMSYQAVVRDAVGNLVTNKQVGMRITILKGPLPGTSVYQETQTPATNANGLVTIEIGGGTGFDAINWGSGIHFIKTETDPEGGTNYSISGTSQLLSVPYALFSGKSGDQKWKLMDNNIFFNDGNVGIGTANPAFKLHVGGFARIENSQIGNSILLNRFGSGNRSTAIDFYGDNTNEYGLRIIRWGTVPAISDISHTGSGNLRIISENEGPIEFLTKSTTRMAIQSDGNIVLANQNIKNLANPVDAQDAATKDYVEKLLKDLGLIANNYAGTMKDILGNVYKTVQIGSQVWMAENLRTEKYNDGTAIPLVTDDTVWGNLTTLGYCWFNNDKATYGNIYGALYNWYTVNTGKLCPTGWHVPSDAEWSTLSTFLGGESVAGGKMKETGTVHWKSPNSGATNESGFSGLPGGDRSYDGPFYDIGSNGYWWSSAETSTSGAWSRGLYYYGTSVARRSLSKGNGFSVRCVRDL